ncbi:MAG: DUF2911 domain-containing protein [Cyclobacteriaceae bacterium]|nr:DUF2911 domain-containing protein [Cyclobacteriaceae bacterium]
MKKLVIILVSIIITVVIAVLAFVYYTKSHSPFEKVKYGDDLKVEYCRPSKKGRVIFGELVPYGKVWRTGANEATVFTTKKDILFGGKDLKSGRYSLWTIPEENKWTVIINSQTDLWGVNMDNVANMDPKYEVLRIETDVIRPEMEFEIFTITLDSVKGGVEMVLVWDRTMISIPIEIK